MSRLKTLVRNQHGVPPLRGGHSLCQGCGVPLVVRTVLSTITQPVVVVNATGCLEVATTRYPTTAWNVPWLHVAFENSAAAASGVEAAYRALRRRGALDRDLTFVVFAGDGGTYDIGLQALSGALERGHRFVFVCYDNEAYMNTGIQRSGATPRGATTTTTPAGSASLGKAQERKDITAIAVARYALGAAAYGLVAAELIGGVLFSAGDSIRLPPAPAAPTGWADGPYQIAWTAETGDWLRQHVEQWSARVLVAVDFHSIGIEERRLPSSIETVLYRVAQEALTNILKHAQATSVSLIVETMPFGVTSNSIAWNGAFR